MCCSRLDDFTVKACFQGSHAEQVNVQIGIMRVDGGRLNTQLLC